MAKEDLMALGPVETEPKEMEEEKAMGMAREADVEMDDMAEMAAPEGKYSQRSLNVLVDALNKVLPLFDPTLPKIGMQSVDIVGKLPPEIIKAITMVNQACKDAALTNLAPSIDAMIDDRGIEMVAGKLILLSKNRDFIMFLKSKPKEMEGEEEGGAKEIEANISIGGGAPGEREVPAEDMNSLFASRIS
jgi:hypothetical protein